MPVLDTSDERADDGGVADAGSSRIPWPVLRAIVAFAVAGVIVACAGENGDTESRATSTVETTAAETRTSESATESTLSTAATSAPVTTRPSTTQAVATVQTTTAPTESVGAEPSVSQQTLVELVQFVASQNWSGGVLPPPDHACFGTEIARDTDDVRAAVDHLTDPGGDPFEWYRLNADVRRAIVESYIDCLESLDGARLMIVLGTINTPEPGCVVDAWGATVDRGFVVSSLTVGLEELPPDVLDRLSAGVLTCLADEEWWREDVALELDGWNDYTHEQAGCIAGQLIDRFGVEPLIRRRLLTIPILSLPPDQLAAIDAGACGVELVLSSWDARTAVGNCIDHFFGEEGEWSAIPCDQAHDAEVVGVEDVTARFPDYPGSSELADATGAMCDRIADAMPPDAEVRVAWAFPSRQTWERGDRTLSCVLGKLDGSPWTGPSGLSPPPPT